MAVRRNNYLLVIMLFLSAVTWAQNDTIQLKNKDLLVGEVKSISKGILIIETAYSDEDFKVEFNKVRTDSALLCDKLKLELKRLFLPIGMLSV